MKQFILLFILGAFCAPAYAVESDLISNSSRNINSSRDGYNLPEYEVTGGNKLARKFNAQSQKSKKNNSPALTIINEPYMPSAVPSNLNHMGKGQFQEGVNAQQPQSLLISDDVPTDIEPPPVKADMVTSAPSPEPVKTVETWRAREGESLYQVLNRWSERAGTKMTWSSTKSPKLPNNISFVGTYQDAVTHAMKVAGADGMNSDWNTKPNMQDEMASLEPVQSYKPETLVIDEVSSPMPLTPEPLPVQEVASLDAAEPMPLEPITNQESLPQRARFYALAGTSLKESLRAWSGTQEFSLVWDTNRDFRVKQTVSSNSDAEMALRDILSMYEGDAVRPIGKLYRDPRTSRPVLVIKSDK